jgi:hypothetical protein
MAFLPQLFAFQLPATRQSIPTNLVAAVLASTQLLLLTFAWINRKKSGGWLLLLGQFLNLLVISLNGGLMPISPETIHKIAPTLPQNAWKIGERLGTGKDIVLPVPQTILPWLTDRFVLPHWFPYQVAFSLGDIFISLGSFWVLWGTGRPSNQQGIQSFKGGVAADERVLSQ